jgi:hypothetical protein
MPPVYSALALSETLSRVPYGALRPPPTYAVHAVSPVCRACPRSLSDALPRAVLHLTTTTDIRYASRLQCPRPL